MRIAVRLAPYLIFLNIDEEEEDCELVEMTAARFEPTQLPLSGKSSLRTIYVVTTPYSVVPMAPFIGMWPA